MIETLLNQGFTVFLQGDYALAKQIYEKIVEDQNYQYCQWYLGLSLFYLGEYDSANLIWLDILASSENSLEEFSLVLEAEATWQEVKFDYSKAMQIREILAAEFPENINNLLETLNLALLLRAEHQIISNLLLGIATLLPDTDTLIPGEILQNIFAQLIDRYGCIPQIQDFYSLFVSYLTNKIEEPDHELSYLLLLAKLDQEIGQYDRAENLVQRAIDKYPNSELAYLEIAKLRTLVGNSQEVAKHCQKALELSPLSLSIQVETYSLLIANYHIGCGIDSLEQLQKLLNNLEETMGLINESSRQMMTIGHTLLRENQVSKSLLYYKDLILLKLLYAKGWKALGKCYASQRNHAQAVICFNQVAQVCQDSLESLEIQGLIYSLNVDSQTDGKYDYLEKLIVYKFFNADYFYNFYLALSNSKQFHRLAQLAITFANSCRNKDKLVAFCLCFGVLTTLGNAEAALPYLQQLTALLQDKQDFTFLQLQILYFSTLFFIPHLLDDIVINLSLIKLIAHRFIHTVLIPQFQFSSLTVKKEIKAPTSRLRIGFFSPHFNNHPVGLLSTDVIISLAKYADIVVYPTNSSQEKSKLVFSYQEVPGIHICQDDIADSGCLIQTINNDHIDVLIDLDGYTESIPPSVLLSRPVPMCVSWLGFDAPYISPDNYFLCDRYTHPEEIDHLYVEQLIRMPHSHMCVGKFDVITAHRDLVRHSLGISPDQVVFFYPALARKFNRQTAHAHIEILKHTPNAVLLRKQQKDRDIPLEIYHEECLKLNVDNCRIISVPPTTTEAEHRFYYLVADVCLDSYPYNGGSQNLEALWFNLPLVTYQGSQSFARMGYSLLSTLEITEGIAHSWQEYIALGIRFGLDKSLRLAIKNKLVKSKNPDALSPLWNPDQFAQDMFTILQDLYTKKLENKNSEKLL